MYRTQCVATLKINFSICRYVQLPLQCFSMYTYVLQSYECIYFTCVLSNYITNIITVLVCTCTYKLVCAVASLSSTLPVIPQRSTDWDSSLGYKQVISHCTRRILVLLTLVLSFASYLCNNNDILLIVGYNYNILHTFT